MSSGCSVPAFAAPQGHRGRPRGMALLLAGLMAAGLAGGCTAPMGKPDPDRNRQLVTSLASDPTVQRSFATGRGRVLDRDPEARRVILGEVVREQQRLLEEPALRDDYLALNARLTREVSSAPATRPLMLENTVDLFERIPDDPELRRRLVDVMRELMKDPALHADMMAMMRSMMSQGGSGGGSGGTGPNTGGMGQGGTGGGTGGSDRGNGEPGGGGDGGSGAPSAGGT